jgi:hypothetical protein
MSKNKKSLVGKIGYCDNANLGIPKPGGHYVYIRELNGGKCDVNVVTSLEYTSNNFNTNRITNIKKGNTYAIPFKDANFTKWSGINHTPIQNVKISDIQKIGNKKIKRRHHFFIRKFMK